MTTIAVTGHMDLTDASVPLVRDALRETLKPYANDLTGVFGESPSGKGGGTADTVLEARDAELPVDVVWPDGASRTS